MRIPTKSVAFFALLLALSSAQAAQVGDLGTVKFSAAAPRYWWDGSLPRPTLKLSGTITYRFENTPGFGFDELGWRPAYDLPNYYTLTMSWLDQVWTEADVLVFHPWDPVGYDSGPPMGDLILFARNAAGVEAGFNLEDDYVSADPSGYYWSPVSLVWSSWAPEPSTWAEMLVGFGIAGGVARCRRARSSALK